MPSEFIKSHKIAGVGPHPQLDKDTLSPWGIEMYSSVRGQVSAQQREHSQGMSKEWGLGCLELVMKSRGVPQMRAMHGHPWSGQGEAGMWCGKVISTSIYFYVGFVKVSHKQRLDTFHFSHVNTWQFFCWGQMNSLMILTVQVKVNCVAFPRKDSLVFRWPTRTKLPS